MIHDKNEAILSILPQLAMGLVSLISQKDIIISFIDEEMKKSQQYVVKLERLSHIKDQLLTIRTKSPGSVNGIHTQKSLLLGLIFGDIYTPALALLTGKQITIQFWGLVEGDYPLKQIEEAFFGDGDCGQIFVEVSREPNIELDKVPLEVNPILQLRGMLAKLGLTINLTTFDVEKIGKSSQLSGANGNNDEKIIAKIGLVESFKHQEHMTAYANDEWQHAPHSIQKKVSCLPFSDNLDNVVVDVHNWFCSCAEFTMQSYHMHNAEGKDIFGPSMASGTIYRFFEHVRCTFPSVLPICKHILAVILLLMNWEVSLNTGLLRVVWMKEDNVEIRINTFTDVSS